MYKKNLLTEKGINISLQDVTFHTGSSFSALFVSESFRSAIWKQTHKYGEKLCEPAVKAVQFSLDKKKDGFHQQPKASSEANLKNK